MCPHLLVVMLISVLQFSFPAVADDCFKELPNNKSYDNCETCYQTLANALVDTGDNKYFLSRAFFPTDAAPPVQVEVTYVSSSDQKIQATWYWLMGGFYLFQPLELFLYRSLFFSPPSLRRESVTLFLPDQCFTRTTTNSTKIFFQHITQRVSFTVIIESASSPSRTTCDNNTYSYNAKHCQRAEAGLQLVVYVDNARATLSE